MNRRIFISGVIGAGIVGIACKGADKGRFPNDQQKVSDKTESNSRFYLHITDGTKVECSEKFYRKYHVGRRFRQWDYDQAVKSLSEDEQ